MRRFYLYELSFLVVCLTLSATSQTSPATGTHWEVSSVGFRPVGITSSNSTFWVCGVGEAIASSADGTTWEVKHRRPAGGALLLGIDFKSDSFGYAFGTAGTLLVTEDGGTIWKLRKLGEDTILAASFADSTHGLFRTREALYYLDGTDTPRRLTPPTDVLKRFTYTPSLVALTPDKMAVLLSDGPHSEAGFFATINSGRNWTFYDPPSTGVASFLRVGERYWATGHEVVDKDKPGGGHSVPLAMYSEDGAHWTHTTNAIQPCHWESCGLCTLEGCLSSGTLLIDFFASTSTYATFPPGAITAKWAKASGRICTVSGEIKCVSLSKPGDVQAMPTVPQPFQQSLPPLGTPTPSGSALTCVSCSIEPVYVDEKIQGQFIAHLALLVRTDGTVETATVDKVPSEDIGNKVRAQVLGWLFEPPLKDGRSVRVSTQSELKINVVRSR